MLGKEIETNFCTGKVGALWLWERIFLIKKKRKRSDGKKLILRLTRKRTRIFNSMFMVIPWLQRLQ